VFTYLFLFASNKIMRINYASTTVVGMQGRSFFKLAPNLEKCSPTSSAITANFGSFGNKLHFGFLSSLRRQGSSPAFIIGQAL